MKITLNYVKDPVDQAFVTKYLTLIESYPCKSCGGDFDLFIKEDFRKDTHPTACWVLDGDGDGIMRLEDYSRKAMEEWMSVEHPDYYTVSLD